MKGKLIALVVTSLLISACGDGGSGDNPPGTQGEITTHENTPQLSAVNGTLRGMYFSSGQNGEGDWLNLESGESGSMFSKIPRDLEAIVPASYGTEYLESYGYKIVIKDWQTGLVTDEFSVAGDIASRASGIRFSPDGKIIGLFRDEFDTFDFRLAFFRRNGERIAEFADDDVTAYEWLPDGRFVFSQDGSLKVGTLGQESFLVSPLVSLQQIPGSPRNIRISPDGENLVFEMVTGSPSFLSGSNFRNASVYRVKTDGTELALVGTMANTTGLSTDEPRVNNPVWSLDGQFLLMSAGVSATAAVFWDTSYSPVTDDYAPLSISDVIVASSPGFMYVLPNNASDVELLNGQSYPAIAHNDGGTPAPYQISTLHIEPGAVLFEPAQRLPETIVTPSEQTGSIIGLDPFEFRDAFTVKEYDTTTGEERILIKIENRNYSPQSFGVSSNKQLFAIWDDQNYDEKYLRIFDNTGTQKESLQMVFYNGGAGSSTIGIDMQSPPQFSPVNDNLLLYRFLDADTKVAGFGVLDWTTGKYNYRRNGNYQSVAWAPDGSIILSEGNDIHRLDFQASSEFPNWEYLFSTFNPVDSLDVNKQGTRMLYTMAGHVFHSNMDGTDIVQITAPSVGYELHATWSPDGRNITLVKDDGWRYIMSADSRNLRIYPGIETNTNRHQYVWGEAASQVYWLP